MIELKAKDSIRLNIYIKKEKLIINKSNLIIN